MNGMEERTNAKVGTSLEKLEAEVETNQEKMTARLEAKIEAKMDSHHEKYEVFRDTLVSWMDIHQAKTESTQEEMKLRWTCIRGRWRPQYTPSSPS
jgi:hypothetical protein